MTTRFDLDTAPVAQGDGGYASASMLDGGSSEDRTVGTSLRCSCKPLVAEVADPDRHARSLTVHYLAPAVEGPARGHGRAPSAPVASSSTSPPVCSQGERLLATAQAAFAVLQPRRSGLRRPELPRLPAA